ncbi:hypothetical protein QFC19_008990 [Naganishia cerealis]|uniref:Uncharacterized protein n=1 Tax=Naganishia cerealis TaxID=610337 RepID=A0ACC2UXM6_9TREE|nr:hypothetical protein QFC19_008990 [Naganishia cerealis]
MSQPSDTAHGYHPRPATEGASRTLKISKRITATPPLTILPAPPPTTTPLGVRLALKTTYSLAVPSSLLPSVNTAARLAERGKAVIKHAQIVRPEVGRMRIRITCIVNGTRSVVPAVQDVFVAGLEQNMEPLGIAALIKTDNIHSTTHYDECGYPLSRHPACLNETNTLPTKQTK